MVRLNLYCVCILEIEKLLLISFFLSESKFSDSCKIARNLFHFYWGGKISIKHFLTCNSDWNSACRWVVWPMAMGYKMIKKKNIQLWDCKKKKRFMIYQIWLNIYYDNKSIYLRCVFCIQYVEGGELDVGRIVCLTIKKNKDGRHEWV